MISRETIEATEVYKGLKPSLQELALKRKNREEIEHGYNVALNRGVENWERLVNPTYINRRIVNELIGKK